MPPSPSRGGRAVRWLILAAFSAGLCINVAQRWRTVLGVLGLLTTFLGLLYNACGDGNSFVAPQPADLHKTIVAETFDDLTSAEAAALVGILHEYRIERSGSDWRQGRPLELRVAVDLVASASGLPHERLSRLYRERWVHLRETTAPRLLAAMREHELVERLVRVSEFA